MNKKTFWLASAAMVFSMMFSLAGGVLASDCGSMWVDAGRDVEVGTDGTVRIDADINGSYDRFTWSCTGGSLSSYNVLDPIYRADYNDSRDFQTCTITVYNGCTTQSDSVRINTWYGRDRATKFRVALLAKPATACAPAGRVDLEATIFDQPSQWRGFTYSFDCNSDGIWDRVITTDDTKITVVDVCDYPAVGQYTARVEVVHGANRVTDTDIIKAEDCSRRENQGFLGASVSITKTVRNITAGGNFMGTVNAKPGDSLEYRIVVTGNSGRTNNVVVRDEIPAGMILTGEPELDGIRLFGADLPFGVNIGQVQAGQTKVIGYTTKVAGSYNFNASMTTLANTATVTADGRTATSNAAVQVSPSGVLPAVGATSPLKSATMVPTGFDAGIALRLVIFAIGVILAGGCAFYFGRKKVAVSSSEPQKVSFGL